MSDQVSGSYVEAEKRMPTDDHADSGVMTSLDHVRELAPIAALGGEDVGDGLVRRPPFVAKYVLLRRAHWDVAG